MKILHTADLHLREYEDERWQALQELVKIGEKEKVSIFLISGDLFDKGTDAENLRPQIRAIFSGKSFKILIIPGNHDKDSYRSDLYFGENTIILSNSVPFEYKKARIIALPFQPLKKEEVLGKIQALKTILTPDKKNILLCHGELLDSFFSRKDFGEEGKERYMPFKLSYFRELNIDYVLAGHFHTSFDIKRLENGGYFVYPGSPVSITRRETGQRKVNIFQLGSPPREHLLDTFYFEEVRVELDPFKSESPLKVVKEHLEKLRPEAKAILTVKGYINGKKAKTTETELVNQIKEIAKGKCAEEPTYLFKDIRLILENDLFKSFINKLEQAGYEERKTEEMRSLAIKAIMRAGL